MSRTILFVTGIRSDYDLLQPVMQAVAGRLGMSVAVVVTGAHLADQFGLTVREVEADGFRVVARIPNLVNSDAPWGRAKSAAIQMMGLVDTFMQIRPSIVVVLGDREEALSASAVGAYMSIPVAHIGGGDTADNGHVDNSVRHAATKFAHLHFVTTRCSQERVLRLGEEPWRIHVVGATGLDRILVTPVLSREELALNLGLKADATPILLVVQHSMNDSPDLAESQMREILSAVGEMQMQVIVGYPNSDAGGQRIIAVIDEYAARVPTVRTYRNLPRKMFVNLLRAADVLVGNTSLGIIEAPLLQLPYVCVGERQKGREHGSNVLFVPPCRAAIEAGIRKALEDGEFRSSVQNSAHPYGDGHAGERIAEILASVPLDAKLTSKRMTY